MRTLRPHVRSQIVGCVLGACVSSVCFCVCAKPHLGQVLGRETFSQFSSVLDHWHCSTPQFSVAPDDRRCSRPHVPAFFSAGLVRGLSFCGCQDTARPDACRVCGVLSTVLFVVTHVRRVLPCHLRCLFSTVFLARLHVRSFYSRSWCVRCVYIDLLSRAANRVTRASTHERM